MADRDIIPLVADLVKEAERYRDTLSADRQRAQEYYDGTMNDTPSDKGRSSVVSRDVRDTIQKVLPALSRVFLASDQIVEYQPVGPGDEEGAEQATDYINQVVFPECDGPRVVTDAIHDALTLRNSVLTWWYEEKTEVVTSSHSGLDEASWVQLTTSDGVEVLEHTEREEQVDTQEGQVPTVVHDLKIKRKTVKRRPRIDCKPLEEFLIHPDAIDEDESPIIGVKTRIRRTDLVAMGYEKDVVDALPMMGADGKAEDAEKLTRRTYVATSGNEITPELQEIDYYDLLVRVDKDGDGIAELRHMCFGGAIGQNTLLHDEEGDTVNYAICAAKSRPHQWEGTSLFDDVSDIQRIKTVLLRGTLDNLYWVNNQQLAVKRSAIENMDAVTNPQFGQAIFISDTSSASDAIQPILVPFVAEKSFQMLGYLDEMKSDRSGVNEASGGMAPDALQNVTAKATALMEQAGIGQTELMARTLARGFQRMFKGLLELIIKHQDKPRTVRLRDNWVSFDPRSWNAEMDCTVNIGLGAGTRERDMAVLLNVFGLQEKIMMGMGPGNPYVTEENFGNTLSKIAEAAGLKSPRLYFTTPTPEETQQRQEAQAQQPNPEMQKMEAEAALQKELKGMELETTAQLKQLDVQAATQKEIAQSQAAVEERQAVVEIESQDKDKDRVLKKYEIDQRNEIEWAKIGVTRETSESNVLLKLKQDEEARVNGERDRAERQSERQADLQGRDASKRIRTPDGEEFIMETMR